MKENTLYFRVDTPSFLKEIVSNALPANMGILFQPLNIFQNLLAQVAQRATELNDPIMNKLMFDLNLYELPSPASPEYTKLMKRVYKEAKEQRKKESSPVALQ